MRLRLSLIAAVAGAAALAACGQNNQAAESGSGEVNLYTARHYDADLALYERFTEETGIRVNRIEGNADQLIARMQSEGANSPADVFVSADAGALWRAQNAGLFQAAGSETLNQAIPENLRAPGGEWFGFSRRARVVAYDSETVSPDEIDT